MNLFSENKNLAVFLVLIFLLAAGGYALLKNDFIRTAEDGALVKPEATSKQESQTPTPSPTPDPNLLLPDLKAEPITEIYIANDPQSGNREIRFNTSVVNLGEGPMEMIGLFDEQTNKTRAVQRVRTKQGSIAERTAGYFIFHPDHEHWHFDDFASLEIFSANPENSTGEILAANSKQTFCLSDQTRILPPIAGSPPNMVYRGCNPVTQGISVGWRDNYEASLAGQEINIQNLPDGRYLLRSTVDPLDRILEKDEANNSSEIIVEISGLSAKIIE